MTTSEAMKALWRDPVYRSKMMAKRTVQPRRPSMPLKYGWDEATADLAYIVGVVMGDASLANPKTITLSIQERDLEFAEAFSTAMEKQFGLKPHWRRRGPVSFVSPNNGKTYIGSPSVEVQFNSRLAHDFLDKLDTAWVEQQKPELQVAWLRGAWDSEGCISPDRAAFRVSFCSANPATLGLYCSLIEKFLGVKTRSTMYAYQTVPQVGFGKLKDVLAFSRLVIPTIKRKRAIFALAANKFSAPQAGELRAELEQLFEQGLGPREAWETVGGDRSYAYRVYHHKWKQESPRLGDKIFPQKPSNSPSASS